jgi:hypothetical protein
MYTYPQSNHLFRFSDSVLFAARKWAHPLLSGGILVSGQDLGGRRDSHHSIVRKTFR